MALALYDLVAVFGPRRAAVLRREAEILGPPLALLVSYSGNFELQTMNWMSRESREVVDGDEGLPLVGNGGNSSLDEEMSPLLELLNGNGE